VAVALHSSERAALRRQRAPGGWRVWRQAALIALPITLVLAVLLAAALVWSGAIDRDGWTSSSRMTVPISGSDPALASPGSGTTGTAPLPAEPAGRLMAANSAATGVSPAAPFSLRGASALDRARATECLTAALYYEAVSEPDDGLRAVAQVVLNRVRHPAFPASVCGVVYQGVERGRGCQFSFACDGAATRVPARAGWARAARVAAAALGGYVYTPVGLATHYHTYAVTPAWNRTLVMTDVVGAHFFHRWKGFWGTAAAFHQRYAGSEPVAGPAPRIATPVIALNHAIAIAPTAPLVGLAAAQIQPKHRDSSTPLQPEGTPAPVSVAPPTPESQILDRWKDSGKPLH
jgi:spore germination cell wall hydrolase CwlJ-like protein